MAKIQKVSFKGDTQQCLHDFLKRFEKDGRMKRIMALFTGARYHPTVDTWFKKENKPLGIYLLKLRFLMEVLGYEIEEFDVYPTHLSYQLAKLLAYDIVTLKEIAQLLKFHTDSVMRIVMGRGGTSAQNETKLENLVQMFKKALEEKESYWNEKIFGTRTPPAAVLSEPCAQRSIEVAKISDIKADHESVLNILALQLQASLALTELVASNEFTAEERTKLRALCGRYTIFNLKNFLVMLCGERARSEISDPPANGGT